MALIAKKSVPTKKQQLNVRLSADTLEMLASYCQFIESNQSYVLEQLLRYSFRKDRAFQEWLLKKQDHRE